MLFHWIPAGLLMLLLLSASSGRSIMVTSMVVVIMPEWCHSEDIDSVLALVFETCMRIRQSQSQ
jgi:hypothetical protein